MSAESLDDVVEESDGSDSINKHTSVDWDVWRAAVDSDMRNILNRLYALEKREDVREELELEKRSNLPTFITPAGGLVDRFRFFASQLRSKKSPIFQCVLLLTILVATSSFAYVKFIEAGVNIDAEFKPEYKVKTIDYSDEENDEQYEMPFVFVYFQISNSGEEWLNKTRESLLESQNNFQGCCMIQYDSWSEVDPEVEVNYVTSKANYITGYFRFKLPDPDPFKGSFRYHIYIKGGPLSAVSEIADTLSVYVDREETSLKDPYNFAHITYSYTNIGMESLFIAYGEKWTQRWQGDSESDLTYSLVGVEEPFDHDTWTDGRTVLTFMPDMKVDYWEEYVAYDYYDWMSAMAGILSISITIFFVGSRKLAEIFGEGNTLGLLPKMSMPCNNFVTVQQLRIHFSKNQTE